MKAKKSFGQNWLRDDYILDKIVDSADIDFKDTVLEVGPGLGTLTQKLVETEANIIAVEADRDLIPGLQKKFNNSKNLHLEFGDILKFNLKSLPSRYKVVANIPYYLTSHLIRNFLEADNAPSVMVLLIQKEVAERIMAKPGKMSVLAFSVQYYARPEYVVDVKKELFEPIPKVDSAVIKIVMHQAPVFEADRQKLFRLVKAGFGEKRKTLRNSLSGGLNIDHAQAENLLNQALIGLTARAQELSLLDWQRLYSVAESEDII